MGHSEYIFIDACHTVKIFSLDNVTCFVKTKDLDVCIIGRQSRVVDTEVKLVVMKSVCICVSTE